MYKLIVDMRETHELELTEDDCREWWDESEYPGEFSISAFVAHLRQELNDDPNIVHELLGVPGVYTTDTSIEDVHFVE